MIYTELYTSVNTTTSPNLLSDCSGHPPGGWDSGRQLLHWDPQKPRAVRPGSMWQLSPPRLLGWPWPWPSGWPLLDGTVMLIWEFWHDHQDCYQTKWHCGYWPVLSLITTTVIMIVIIVMMVLWILARPKILFDFSESATSTSGRKPIGKSWGLEISRTSDVTSQMATLR